jgi:hypothetical protein
VVLVVAVAVKELLIHLELLEHLGRATAVALLRLISAVVTTVQVAVVVELALLVARQVVTVE